LQLLAFDEKSTFDYKKKKPTRRFYRVPLLKKGRALENAVIIVKWSGITKIAIISSKINLDPNFVHRL
jgi:hypothetical protein